MLKINNILIKILDFFLPRINKIIYFDQVLKLRTAIVCLFILVISFGFMGFRTFIFYGGLQIFSILSFIFIVFCIILLWFLKKDKYITLVFTITLFLFISLNLMFMYHNSSGMENGLLWTFVIIITSIFLLGPIKGTIISAISVSSASYFYWLDQSGYPFPHFSILRNETAVLLTFVIFLSIITAILTWLYELGRNHSASLEKLKKERYKKLYQRKSNTEKLLEKAYMEMHHINDDLERRVKIETQKALDKEMYLNQQSKLAAMGEMLQAIAHQWRQPLNSLAIAIQDILEAQDAGSLDRKYLSKFVDSSMESIRHMSETIDDFRNFLKPSKEMVLFDIIKSTKDAIRISLAQIDEHHIKIVFNEPSERDQPVLVFGAPGEFTQVILNLINNSKDAIEDYRRTSNLPNYPGKILINAEKGETVKIIFEDNGGGIPAKILDRVFEPYFTTKDPTVGTGIGLYMSKQIVETSMSGWIFVSNSEQGAKFTMIFSKH